MKKWIAQLTVSNRNLSQTIEVMPCISELKKAGRLNLFVNSSLLSSELSFRSEHSTCAAIEPDDNHGYVVLTTPLKCSFDDKLGNFLRVQVIVAAVDCILVAQFIPYAVTGDDQILVERLDRMFGNMWRRHQPDLRQCMIAKSPCHSQNTAQSIIQNDTAA